MLGTRGRREERMLNAADRKRGGCYQDRSLASSHSFSSSSSPLPPPPPPPPSPSPLSPSPSPSRHHHPSASSSSYPLPPPQPHPLPHPPRPTHLVDARHDGEDSRVRDHRRRDARLRSTILKLSTAQHERHTKAQYRTARAPY
eukprot:2270220-Rhodomonas_salina.1